MIHRPWTMPEQRRAIELREEGLSYDKISYLLGSRSADSVAARLRYIGKR